MNTNLIELIGIIEGINYDGIINELEVLRLNEWLSHNQQFKNDNEFTEIVKKLERILEDGFVSSNEKNELLDYAHMFSSNHHDIDESLMTLNGIIEGIVCDNIINKDEIVSLQKWLNNNRFLRGNNDYDSIYSIVEEVLKDNILTKEEQMRLKYLFELLVSDSQTNLRINYLKNKINSKQNIGVELIDLIDNESLIEQIHRKACKELQKRLNSYSKSASIDEELVFISLVLIGLLKYDASYYEKVKEVYGELYNDYSEQLINGQIRTITNRFRNNSGDEGPRIINYILMNCLVPKYFLPEFFDFIYDIYKVNFGYDLPNDLVDDFKFIFSGLKKSLDPESDELILNATKKTYKLIKSTKTVILLQNSVEEIINLSINIIKLIDRHYWEEKEPVVNNIYYKYGYEKWLENNNKKESIKKDRARTRDSFVSRWEPSLKINQNDIYLIPPVHKIRDRYDYKKIKLVVSNGNKILEIDERPAIYEIIGGYEIRPEKIKVESPLGSLNYKIYEDDNIIYDSKKALYRDVIAFNLAGNEIPNKKDYEGQAVLCHYKSEGKTIEDYYLGNNYNIGFTIIDKSTVLHFGDTILTFCSAIDPGLVGDINTNCYLQAGNIQVPSYRKIKMLAFECDLPSDKIGIRINNINKKLSSFNFEVLPRGTYLHYIVEIVLEKAGLFEIEAFEISTNSKISNTRFLAAVDPSLQYKTSKLDERNYIIEVESDLPIKNNYYQLNVDEFDSFQIPLRIKNYAFKYIVPLDLKLFKIDEGKWLTSDDYIWIDDINFSSVLSTYGISSNLLCIESEKEILCKIESSNKGLINSYKIDVIRNFKNDKEKLVLNFYKSMVRETYINCFMQCVYNKNSEIIFNPVTGILDIKLEYIGKGRVGLQIFDDDKIVADECVDESKTTLSFDNIESFKDYNFIVYEKAKGFSLSSKREMYKFNEIFYKYSDFLSKTFRINRVEFDQFNGNELKRCSYDIKSTFIKFRELINDNNYLCSIYYMSKDGCEVGFPFNPVELEITSEPHEGKFEASITKDGDGLLMDFKHKGINQNLDDLEALDIFSYYINLKGDK